LATFPGSATAFNELRECIRTRARCAHLSCRGGKPQRMSARRNAWGPCCDDDDDSSLDPSRVAFSSCATMNEDKNLASVLAEVTEAYRTEGTLGAGADAFNRALVDRIDEARQYAGACNELHDAVRHAAETGAFCSGDYMVYFTLSLLLRRVSLVVIFRALSEAVRLSATTEFGLAWDLIQAMTVVLSDGGQQAPEEDVALLMGHMYATVLASPVPADRESELPSSMAAVLAVLPSYFGRSHLQCDCPGAGGGEAPIQRARMGCVPRVV
jgi:hypothetical protein